MTLRTRALFGVLLVGCTATGPAPEPTSPTPTSHTPTPAGSPTSPSEPTRVEVRRILEAARAIVDEPREASSASFRIAAREVERRFAALGYDVRRQPFDVPAGVSWGVPVPAGRSRNVVAEPRDFDTSEPHVIVGAHLDTVPQAPGANDNAGGVAIVLELARMAMLEPSRVPIVFVAFGAEEPRTADGTGHHYGSRAYVAAMSQDERDALIGIASLDRVGIGDDVRVCTASGAVDAFARRFLRRADRLGIDARACANRASDHVPFADAGMPGIRLLGAEHPTYHTAEDTLDVLERAQLRRMARLAWETLRRVRQRS